MPFSHVTFQGLPLNIELEREYNKAETVLLKDTVNGNFEVIDPPDEFKPPTGIVEIQDYIPTLSGKITITSWQVLELTKTKLRYEISFMADYLSLTNLAPQEEDDPISEVEKTTLKDWIESILEKV